MSTIVYHAVSELECMVVAIEELNSHSVDLNHITCYSVLKRVISVLVDHRLSAKF